MLTASMSRGAARKALTTRFSTCGVEAADREAGLVISAAAGLRMVDLIADPEAKTRRGGGARRAFCPKTRGGRAAFAHCRPARVLEPDFRAFARRARSQAGHRNHRRSRTRRTRRAARRAAENPRLRRRLGRNSRGAAQRTPSGVRARRRLFGGGGGDGAAKCRRARAFRTRRYSGRRLGDRGSKGASTSSSPIRPIS